MTDQFVVVGEAGRKRGKKKLEYDQQEMFPEEYHPHYKVINHHMMIIDGESVWISSAIMWRQNDTARNR